MKNVLVTGGAGFIGSNFIRYLLANGSAEKVINLDALTYAGNIANLAGVDADARYRFVHADIRSREVVQKLLVEEQIDTIVHFAAETHVDRSIIQPEIFIESNVLGTFQLLEAARLAWGADFSGKRFHHVSTDEVYGTLSPDEPAFTESTPYNPRSPYSASKAGSDHCARAYFHTYGLPVTLSNCSNNYGPYQYPEKFIPVIILNCLIGEPIPVYGDGQQVRDWIYVEDHCAGILRVLQAGAPGETYHLGGGNQISNLHILKQVCALMDRKRPDSPYTPHKSLLRFVTDRPGHDRRYAMDCAKAKAELGWQAQEDLAGGLEKTIDWYLGHMDWLLAAAQDEKYRAWIRAHYKKEQR
jgi:dTDP-glucose 4,6-dehydratase